MVMQNSFDYKDMIENYRIDYHYSNNNFTDYLLFRKIGNILLKKDKYKGFEYRFLSWLIYQNIIPNSKNINLPYLITNNIKSIVKEDFFYNYCFISPKRKEIYDSLLCFIHAFKAENKIKNREFNILVGGSFTDITNQNPSDIDFIIKIPQKLWDKKFSNKTLYHNFIKMNRSIEFLSRQFIIDSFDDKQKYVDFHLLPDKFSLNKFKAYNDFIMLTNNAQVKDKLEKEYANNIFIERKIISLTI